MPAEGPAPGPDGSRNSPGGPGAVKSGGRSCPGSAGPGRLLVQTYSRRAAARPGRVGVRVPQAAGYGEGCG